MFGGDGDMSFTPQYPPVLTDTGDTTGQVLAKYNQEFQYLYTTLLSQLFSNALGHGHTGDGSDGAQITTAALVDNVITTPKILDANVTTDKIADSNITTPKIANGAITAAKLASEILLMAYPVGAIYISAVATSPATLFGGTWAQIKDTFLLSCGDAYANGTTGGEATHTLNTNEMPSHNHLMRWDATGPANVGSGLDNTAPGGYGGQYLETSYTGGGQAHNNMPPFLAVYVWKRVG